MYTKPFNGHSLLLQNNRTQDGGDLRYSLILRTTFNAYPSLVQKVLRKDFNGKVNVISDLQKHSHASSYSFLLTD